MSEDITKYTTVSQKKPCKNPNGRPCSIADAPAQETMIFRATADMKYRLKRIAKNDDATLGSVIRHALEIYMMYRNV